MSSPFSELEPFGRDIGFGYVDRSIVAPLQHNPQLVLNTASSSMLRALRYELKHSSSFTFSVAFVSPSALALLKQELLDFAGVGRIVTSNYLSFNSPHAFAELLNLMHLGVDVRIHPDPAFHPKGYIFGRPDSITAILGSSNLTVGAITRNHEWNLRVAASRDSDLAAQFTNLLDREFNDSVPLSQAWIDEYAETYSPPLRVVVPTSKIAEGQLLEVVEEIQPNAMQTEALSAIAKVRESGAGKALIISATGTGKTILSALDVRAVNPGRMLFVAHREQILDRAIQEFQRVLQAPVHEFGKLAGGVRQHDRKYVFATVQTLSQPALLTDLDPRAFDYILIDEVHRAGAASFDRVLDHFQPRFLLGMTATPERSDGANIFELFDYNVPYEIRLKSALELDMLSPFHYYGVADFTFEDGATTSEATSLARLVDNERVAHVLSALDKYGQAGVAPRGLIFCSRKEEARALSELLNTRQFRGQVLRTVALTGDDPIDHRERQVERLEAGELDYILTVDIFNEGVDIPSVNQVIMLRQTQSSIVFVQQLGRGLRKAEGKDYLVVIDFIGNYANNYLIPVALFGDESLNKESLRKNLISAEEVGVIAGLSSIRFDKIAQERVLRSLAESKLDSYQNLKNAIETVRQRVGRMPRLYDFLRFESVDPILLATKDPSYPALLARLFKTDSRMSDDELSMLAFASHELLDAKRPHELVILRHLLDYRRASEADLKEALRAAGASADSATLESALRSLSLSFNVETERKKYREQKFVESDGGGAVSITPSLSRSYGRSEEFAGHLDDLIDTGLEVIGNRYDPSDVFTPGRQYRRKDVSRLLNWTSNQYATIQGYKVDKITETCPIFVTLHKSEEVSASTAYRDELIDPSTLLWFTRHSRTLDSKEVKPIVENRVEIHVFAKKDDYDGPNCYYLGRARAADAEETTMPATDGSPLPVVQMVLRFEEPINAALFDYFHATITED